MARLMLLLGAAAALALGLTSTAPANSSVRVLAATSKPAARAPLMGVNIAALGSYSNQHAVKRVIAQARAVHAGVVRAEMPWSMLEPFGRGRIDPAGLAAADSLIDAASAAGIQVIATVDSTPCWASSAPTSILRKCSPTRSNKANAWPPANPADYAAFVAYLAQRYGTRLAAIEIWNEPDQRNEHYFAGPNKAPRYAEVLRAAYPAIKRANPSVNVLAGSLVGYNGVFLRALYAAGIKGYYDALAVHFYSLTLASLRSFRQAQLASGDTKPLWLDEFGWSSCWPRYKIQQEQACVNRKVQAANITNLFRSLARTPYIAAEALYQLQGSRTEDFGVLSERDARKPSFKALSRVIASPFAPPSPVTLSLRRQGNHVLAKGSGPVGDFMQLEAFQGSVLRYKALFTLNRFNQYSIALPSALGTSGLRVHVYQDWMGSGRDAQKGI